MIRTLFSAVLATISIVLITILTMAVLYVSMWFVVGTAIVFLFLFLLKLFDAKSKL